MVIWIQCPFVFLHSSLIMSIIADCLPFEDCLHFQMWRRNHSFCGSVENFWIKKLSFWWKTPTQRFLPFFYFLIITKILVLEFSLEFAFTIEPPCWLVTHVFQVSMTHITLRKWACKLDSKPKTCWLKKARKRTDLIGSLTSVHKGQGHPTS